MSVIINYDLKDKHIDVKDAMIADGYQDYFQYTEWVNGKPIFKRVNLPNTTLYHSGKSSVTARNELQNVARNKGATLQKAFAINFDKTNWASYQL